MEFLCGTYAENHGNTWDRRNRLKPSKPSKSSLDLDGLNDFDGLDVFDGFGDYTGYFWLNDKVVLSLTETHMQYEVFNHGSTRKLPYEGMNIEIARKSAIYTHDREMAEALARSPFVQMKPAIDLENAKIADLRRLAKERGLMLQRGDKRNDIIRKLRGVENV